MIVITGGSDGLGKELARQFRIEGKTVINLSRSENHEVENIPVDLTDPHSVERAATTILGRPESLDTLVNCAGVLSLEPLDAIRPEEIARVFGVNVMGAMPKKMEISEVIINRK